MNDTLAAPKELPPLYVTEQELMVIFWDECARNKWARDTIGDLWRLGSPHPGDHGKGAHGRRLLLPSQYLKWVEDVLTKDGRPLDAAAKMYNQMMKGN